MRSVFDYFLINIAQSNLVIQRKHIKSQKKDKKSTRIFAFYHFFCDLCTVCFS